MVSTDSYVKFKSIDGNKIPLVNKIGIWGFAIASMMTIISLDMYIPKELIPVTWVQVVVLLVAVLLVMPIHEALHGVGFKKWSDKVEYGAKFSKWLLFYCYATSPGAVFTRRQIIVIVLLPQLLTVVAMLAFLVLRNVSGEVSYFLLGLAACNFSGSALDFWALSRILREPKGYLFEDTKTGMDIWKKGESSVPTI